MADRESAVERTDDLPAVPAGLTGGRSPADDGARTTDRDPTALAAWRRVAEQRRRRLLAENPDAPVGSELDGADAGPDGPRRGAPAERGESAPEHPGTAPDRHEVLLGLAGRIDDDALSAVRELVAVEDTTAAAELLGGCLLAGRVGVTPDERSLLDGWFVGARVDPGLVAALPVDHDGARRPRHRFAAALPAGASVPATGHDGETVARVAQRLPGVRRVRQCWRLTPAGSAPGPVPHRVVLVETDSADDRGNVTHHVAHAVRALGTVSVEVFATGADLPAYHRDALAVAMPLTPEAPEAWRPDSGPAERETWHTVADSATREPLAVDGDDGPDRDEPGGIDPFEPRETVEPLDDREPSATDEPPDPARSDPARSDPARSDPARSDPARSDPALSDPALSDLDSDAAAARIAALWAQPSPVDAFSAPLSGPLEPTGLEPPFPENELALGPPTDGLGAYRPVAGPDDAAGRGDDDADLGRVRRARHSRGGEGDDVESGSSRSHDDRGGTPWGSGDGPDPLLASPIEIGPDPRPTNGHHPYPGYGDHGPDTGPLERRSDLAATPLDPAWHDPTPTDPTLRRPEPDRTLGPAPSDSTPPSASPPVPSNPPAEPPRSPRSPSEWNAQFIDTGEGVSQLSERERELLARLHEELAARERLDPQAADPLTRRDPDPPTEDQARPSVPSEKPPARRNGHVNGHVNGHDLPRRRGPSHGSE